MQFWKYHGLGNDYLVINCTEAALPTPQQISRLCHRNTGIGADGIVFRVAGGNKADHTVRIFNPDGSEAEKSGNGLRIFTRWLVDNGFLDLESGASIQTPGGVVTGSLLANGEVEIGMGQVQMANERFLTIENEEWRVYPVTVGNPHCVVLWDGAVSAELPQKYGSLLENHPFFPRRTNVQFVHVIDRKNIAIEIHERGAGRTLASGSSCCAAAAVTAHLGLTDRELTVQMPGGTLEIRLDEANAALMRGAVSKVMEGVFSAEIFN